MTIAQARAELAPTGVMRVGINLGNPVVAWIDPVTGTVAGVAVDRANALAHALDLTVELVTYPSAGRVFDALDRDEWDVAFLAIDPARAQRLRFSPRYMAIEATSMVPAASPLRHCDEVDRAGTRIAAADGAAYALHLSRHLRHAVIRFAPTPAEAIALMRGDRLEAVAGIRPALEAAARSDHALRVLPVMFSTIEQGIATPLSRIAAASYVRGFVEAFSWGGEVQ